jgi:SAM-dependent methyltransferase
VTDDEKTGEPTADEPAGSTQPADYRDVNRALWDDRAPAHAASPDYGFDRFIADPQHLSGVVRFDRTRLGDVRGLRGVHLQCHIGTDTLSLHRLGARMTGLDLSPASLDQARRLAAAAQADIHYVEAELYAATDVLEPGSFDLVYTGIGALCWLPDIRRWARTVADLLRPGGRLFMREGHPMLWALAEGRPDGLLAVEYPYFETEQPLVFDEPGTYVQTDAQLSVSLSHSWNHGLGEIITALMEAGLTLTSFEEHDSVPWDAHVGDMTMDDDGEYRLRDRPERVACSYTLQAVKAS